MVSKDCRALRFKITFVTLLFSLVPLLCLGTSIYYQYRQAYKENVIESLRARVQNRSSHLQTFFDERIAQLTTVAQTHSIDNLQNTDYLKVIFQALLSRSDSFVDLGIIDRDGSHLAYVGPFAEKLKNADYSHERWFHEAMSSGTFISDVLLGFRQVPHIFIVVRRIEGDRTWLLRATINSEVVDQIVRRAQLGKNGDAFIINRANILQTTPRFSGKVLQNPAAPDFSSTTNTNIQEVKFGGQPTLFAASELTSPKWVLVVREELNEDLFPLLRARNTEFLIMIAGILLIVAGAVLTARSMTNALARMEQEKARSDDIAIQSSKMAALGKMAAGIAHEINNPLQVMKELTGLMKDSLEPEDATADPETDTFRTCIRKIDFQLDRCRDITHKMLRFGRRMEPQNERCDVNLALAEAVGFLEDEARHRDITVESSYSESLPAINTDMPQLQQAFLNILDNAIDAIGRSGKITVATEYDRDQSLVVIKIADTGCGIPKEQIPKIFDPFYTTKNPKEGIGLGLSVSYGIIEQLNGRISVESERGRGTTFTISLPARQEP